MELKVNVCLDLWITKFGFLDSIMQPFYPYLVFSHGN
jgi:hypothetical protein